LKKAVATALVLIAGAAVVLWYGNTLNSWVLGGLIGGFAALLLSIPISLTLFTYLSHRHEERLQAEKEAEEAERHEQMERAYPQPVYVYREIPVTGRTVSIEEEEFDPESNTYIAANRNGTTSWLDERGRSLQGPPSPRQLPAPRKTQYPALRAPRTQPSTAATRKLTRELERTRQPAVTRRLGYPGFPGYQSEESRSRYQSLQSQALRMAREEAARQYDEEDGLVIDSSLSPISPDQENATTGKIASRKTRFFTDPETEVPDMQPFTGDLHKPLQRRAPYMYEDDRQRHGFLQQGVPPITRRSSRRLSTPLDDE
jgi:hypothetical protein